MHEDARSGVTRTIAANGRGDVESVHSRTKHTHHEGKGHDLDAETGREQLAGQTVGDFSAQVGSCGPRE